MSDAEVVSTISCKLPEGLYVAPNAYGNGVFTSKAVKRGEVIYHGAYRIVPNVKNTKYELIVECHPSTDRPTQRIVIDRETHLVQLSKTECWLFIDCFMNHSCEPALTTVWSDRMVEQTYFTVALKDLEPDTELTCDYNTFEWDSEGKVIEQCLCGCPTCIGRIAGFKYLTKEQQKAKLSDMAVEPLQQMAADPNEHMSFLVLDCSLFSDAIRLDVDSKTLKVIGTIDAGATILKAQQVTHPDDGMKVLVIEFVAGERRVRVWIDIGSNGLFFTRPHLALLDNSKEMESNVTLRELKDGVSYELAAQCDLYPGDKLRTQ